MPVELHRRVQRKIARGFAAGVEMLVEPLVGGNEAARLVPRYNDFLLSLFPHDRVAFADRNHNYPPRTIAVGFFIQARIADRHVAAPFGFGKLDVNTSSSCAPSNIGVKLVPGSHVGKEIAVPIGPSSPCAVQGALLNHLGL